MPGHPRLSSNELKGRQSDSSAQTRSQAAIKCSVTVIRARRSRKSRDAGLGLSVTIPRAGSHSSMKGHQYASTLMTRVTPDHSLETGMVPSGSLFVPDAEAEPQRAPSDRDPWSRRQMNDRASL